MFESILEEINGFGYFQIINILLLWTSRLVLPCHILLNNFIGVKPPHHCDVSRMDDARLFGNLTEEQRLTVRIPVGEDGKPKSCEMFSEPQFHLLFNSSNSEVLPTVKCQSGWVYDNSTFRSTLVTEWDLVCNRKSLSKTINTIFFVGVMMGSIVFGYLCDKLGRRSTLLVSYILALVFSFSSSIANSWITFAVLRFFSGFSLTGISVNVLVLSVEWVDTRHRAYTNIILSLAWSVGSMLLAGLAFLITDWRKLTMIITSPLIFAVLTWWWVPESARWLLANGKVDEAKFYLDKCATINKRPKLSKCKVETLSCVEMFEKQEKSYSYLHLFKTPKIRQMTLLSGTVCFGNALTYYGIILNISGFGLNMYLTHFIYAAIEVPAKLMVYFLLNIIGRRKCQSSMLLMTGACIALNIFIPQDLWYVRAVVAILGKGLSEASFTTSFLYTSELYPTVIRQIGLGFTGTMGRVGISIAPLILMLEDFWTPFPQVIICSVATICGLATLPLPETLNVRLPETIDDIEMPRKNIVSTDIIKSPNMLLEGSTSTTV